MSPRRRSRRGGKILLSLPLVLLLLLAVWLVDRYDLSDIDLSNFRPSSAATAVSSAASGIGPDELTGLEVYFLDVGQGDSELIRYRTPEDGTFCALIDTGEYAYADGLIDYLQNLGVEKLDYFIVSHPHTDHMGCAARIVQRFEIGRFCMPHVPEEMAPTTSAYEALLDAITDKDIIVDALNRTTVLDMPRSLSLEVLAPRENADWDDLNNWSGVLRLTYGETSFLFTGDAESQSEKLILEDAEVYGWDLKTDVLKCGHHGSSTSSSARFLKAVLPKYAVISCGKDNEYGHPHQDTLKKLNKLETEVYRTDRDGTVLAKSDGKSITWETGLSAVTGREWN